MDDRGNIYAPDEPRPDDTVDIESMETVDALKAMNRACRRVYYAEIKRGASESAALRTALNTLPPPPKEPRE